MFTYIFMASANWILAVWQKTWTSYHIMLFLTIKHVRYDLQSEQLWLNQNNIKQEQENWCIMHKISEQYPIFYVCESQLAFLIEIFQYLCDLQGWTLFNFWPSIMLMWQKSQVTQQPDHHLHTHHIPDVWESH